MTTTAATAATLIRLHREAAKAHQLSQEIHSDDEDDDENQLRQGGGGGDGGASGVAASSSGPGGGRGKRLEARLDKLAPDALTALVRVSAEAGDLPDLLSAIFAGSRVSSASGRARRRLVFLETVSLLDQGGIIGSKNFQEKCIVVLLSDLDRLSLKTYDELVNATIDGMSDKFQGSGSSFELLPHVVSRIVSIKSGHGDALSAGGGATAGASAASLGLSASSSSSSASAAFDADHFQDTVVKRICRTKWALSATTNVVKGLRGFHITSYQMVRLVRKILDQFSSVPLSDLPPLVNQLLLLSAKGEQQLILCGLADHFDKLDVECAARNRAAAAGAGTSTTTAAATSTSAVSYAQQLRNVEGTVLLHFNFAIKQDQSLAKILLQDFGQNASSAVFSPFRIGMMLSMNQIHRFAAPAIESVVSAARNEYPRVKPREQKRVVGRPLRAGEARGRDQGR